MSLESEFATVDLVARSHAETRGIDAFALAVIKAERQIRRLFTHIVYQSPHFDSQHIAELRTALVDEKRCYFEGFERGIDGIAPVTLEAHIGGVYPKLRAGVERAIGIRNKVFHGQLTGEKLGTGDLLLHVGNVRAWCAVVAEAGSQMVGYDGFRRNSFHKGRPGVADTFKVTLQDVGDYRVYLRTRVARR